LFGDILTATWPEVWLTVLSCIIVVAFLIITRKRLILSTFAPEFLFIRGIKVAWLDYAFFVMTALTIAVSIRVIGVILMTGLLILPAAVARNMARSFKSFMWLAIIVSVICTLLGLLLSYQFNLPTGPTIILVGTVLFALTLAVREK
jgi:zinc transport system permease protein